MLVVCFCTAVYWCLDCGDFHSAEQCQSFELNLTCSPKLPTRTTLISQLHSFHQTPFLLHVGSAMLPPNSAHTTAAHSRQFQTHLCICPLRSLTSPCTATACRTAPRLTHASHHRLAGPLLQWRQQQQDRIWTCRQLPPWKRHKRQLSSPQTRTCRSWPWQ